MAQVLLQVVQVPLLLYYLSGQLATHLPCELTSLSAHCRQPVESHFEQLESQAWQVPFERYFPSSQPAAQAEPASL